MAYVAEQVDPYSLNDVLAELSAGDLVQVIPNEGGYLVIYQD